MKVIFKAPGEKPELRDIENKLDVLQDLVQGYVEHVRMFDHGDPTTCGLLINEEGKLHNMDPNFKLYGDMIVGPAVFVGEDGEEFTDLSEEDIEMIMLRFTEV